MSLKVRDLFWKLTEESKTENRPIVYHVTHRYTSHAPDSVFVSRNPYETVHHIWSDLLIYGSFTYDESERGRCLTIMDYTQFQSGIHANSNRKIRIRLY